MSTCRGTKADGSPCTYAAKENGFCGKHAVQAAAGHHNTTASMSSTGTCRGTKADGSPCSYVAKENGFCGKHAGQVVGGHRITTASTSICRGTKADGSPCTYAAKENGFCGKHADRALAGKKYIAAALPKRTTHKSCDVDDKVFAETVDPSLVAQVSIPVLLVNFQFKSDTKTWSRIILPDANLQSCARIDDYLSQTGFCRIGQQGHRCGRVWIRRALREHYVEDKGSQGSIWQLHVSTDVPVLWPEKDTTKSNKSNSPIVHGLKIETSKTCNIGIIGG